MNVTTVVQEDLEDEALGKEVHQLLLGFNLVAGKLLWGQLPEPVPLGEEVLGPVGDALVHRKIEGRLVVFEHSGLYGGSNFFIDRQGFNQLE